MRLVEFVNDLVASRWVLRFLWLGLVGFFNDFGSVSLSSSVTLDASR